MPGNVETAKAVYEAFGKGDMETLKGLFAEVAGSWTEFSVEPAQFIDGGAKAKAALG